VTKNVRSHESWEPLPGRPAPYVLRAGQGERSIIVDQLATVLVSGDETGGQFGIQLMQAPRCEVIPAHVHPGVHHTIWVLDGAVHVWAENQAGFQVNTVLEKDDLLFLPAGTVHTYAVESDTARMVGVNTGGFERFVHAMGVPTDAHRLPVGPIPPAGADYAEAGREFGILMRPDWDYAAIDGPIYGAGARLAGPTNR
jgi:quercetin 2,3-dioxygenase